MNKIIFKGRNLREKLPTNYCQTVSDTAFICNK